MSLQWRLIGLSVLVLLVGAVLYGIYQHGFDSADKAWKAKWADQQVLQAKAFATSVAVNRIEEQRRQTAFNQAGSDAQEQNQIAAFDAAGADAVGQRLYIASTQLATGAGKCTGDPGVAERSASATRAAMVLSDLFQRADKRAGELAKAYDQARIAGLACEAASDFLHYGHETK